MIDFKLIPLGAKPSPPDERDYPISRLAATVNVFPDNFIIPYAHTIKSQGAISSCVSHSLSYCREIVEEKQNNKYIEFSDGFVYANRESSDYQGEGMHPREALNSLKKYGIVPKEVFPYNDLYPLLRNRLNANRSMYMEKAEPYKISSYCRLYSANEIKNALMQLGPVTITLPMYMSFYNSGYVIKRHNPTEKLLGYHQVTITGWKNVNGLSYWMILNSWGNTWGDKGFGLLDPTYEMAEAWSITDNILPHPEVQPEKQKYWRVQLGAFAVKRNCEKLQNELGKKGIGTYMVFIDNLYKLQLGAFAIKENAIRKQQEMINMGYSTYLINY